MELRTYIAILRRRKWIIILTTVVVTLLAALLSYLATPVYRSSTTVRVATVGGGLTDRPDIRYSERLMNTYSQIVTSGNTLKTIVKELDLQEVPTINADVVLNTELLKILVEATDPQVARDVAEATANILIQTSRDLYAGGGQSTLDILNRQLEQTEQELTSLRSEYEKLLADKGIDSPDATALEQSIEFKQRTYNTLLEQYEYTRLNEALLDNAVTVIEPATLPKRPAKPRIPVNIALGVIIGIMGGVVLAMVRENLDTKLYTPKQVESTLQLPVVGRIPAIPGSVTDFELVSHNSYRPEMEAFRRLRIALLTEGSEEASHTFVITSAEPGDGKSTVVANLAVSIAKSGRTVVVVDTDLHMPTQHQIFSLENDRGLTTILTRQANVAGVVQTTLIPNLYVITSGPTLPEYIEGAPGLAPAALADQLMRGTELLGAPLMGNLVNELRETYDVVLFDTPAMLTVTDAAVLAPLVDKVVLVVVSERSQRDSLFIVREQLANVNAKEAVVVINQDREQAKVYRKARRMIV